MSDLGADMHDERIDALLARVAELEAAAAQAEARGWQRAVDALRDQAALLDIARQPISANDARHAADYLESLAPRPDHSGG